MRGPWAIDLPGVPTSRSASGHRYVSTASTTPREGSRLVAERIFQFLSASAPVTRRATPLRSGKLREDIASREIRRSPRPRPAA